ncbi:MAG: hypothetical protein BRD50_07905 [Bacteroidetes bacterium SW_11_45_7]|nr:MAG: hypothetical protein BRD50_07905 [Bacteroidetes bacterium SW_11_45_7]
MFYSNSTHLTDTRYLKMLLSMKNISYAIAFIVLILFTGLMESAYAQNDDQSKESLAQQYYQKQEYEKAADLFQELYNNNPQSSSYYRYLYNTLLKLKRYNELLSIVKEKKRQNQDELQYFVDLGYVLLQDGKTKRGQKQYRQAIDNLSADKGEGRRLANSFATYGENKFAIKALKKARKLTEQPYAFSMTLAKLYQKAGKNEKAIGAYLDFIKQHPDRLDDLKDKLQQKLSDEKLLNELQDQLYSRIQDHPQNSKYSELLIWQFIQRKDYESAFRQAIALDKRMNENGFRVLNLARSAMDEKEFSAAVRGYEYIVDEKGKGSSLYFVAKKELLKARKKKVTETENYTQEDLRKLKRDYKNFLTNYASNEDAVQTRIDLAELEALYIHNLDTAITILEEVIENKRGGKKTIAKAKLALGDYYLIRGDVWDATLLYSQVDKAFKDGPLGEKARYKNAKLSYYRGEFEWAQTQLDALKASTSELISNDALELSVFITDNLGMDTSKLAMLMYARADLYIFQNKYNKAMSKLDSLEKYYADHKLADDLAMAKARIHKGKGDYQKAISQLKMITKNHDDDILADNAKFMLAEIYDHKLDNAQKAMKYYESLLFDHKDSVYVVEARKRFRALRGDQVN